MFPMFIEGIKEDNIVKSKTLGINKKYDVIEQPGKSNNSSNILGNIEEVNF